MTFTSTYGLTTFQPPSWPSSGNPTPTPGTPVAISTGATLATDYNAFPDLTVVGTTLHLVYQKGPVHAGLGSTLVYSSKPFGGEWSALQTAVAAEEEGASEYTTGGSLCPLPNGDILLAYTTVTTPGGVRTPRCKILSGGVWSSSSVFTTDFASGQVTGGHPHDIWGSTILAPVYARTAGSGLRGIYLYQADVGTPRTFTQRCNVVADGARSLDWEEPCLFKRSDGLAICLIRDDVTKKAYLSWSPDLTRWSYPLAVFDGWGEPNAGINPSDDMLCITRHPTNNRAVYSFSGDSGLTWSASAYVDSNTGAMEYGSAVWVPGRGWVAVYSVAGVKDSPEEYNGPAVLYEVAFA